MIKRVPVLYKMAAAAENGVESAELLRKDEEEVPIYIYSTYTVRRRTHPYTYTVE